MALSTETSLSEFQSIVGWEGGVHDQKFAFKSLGDDGELIAAVTGSKIRVLSMFASCDDVNEVVSVYLEDGTTQIGPKFLAGALITSTQFVDVSGTGLDNTANANQHVAHLPPCLLPFSPAGWCETTAGAALNAEFSAAITTGKVEFMIVYQEIP